MLLSWSDTAGIAAALHKAYPETDRLSLDSAALGQMIRSLEGFHDNPDPPAPAHLNAVLWNWMRFAGDDDDRGGG
jgi:FeS assembly protein IscX